jgi:hypothetical protein
MMLFALYIYISHHIPSPKVFLHHPKRLPDEPAAVEQELRHSLPALHREWLERRAASLASKAPMPPQKNVLGEFVATMSPQFPNTCLMLEALLASPANTSPLERSYSMLQKICEKRRNRLLPKHLETLYLLKVLGIEEGYSKDYLPAVRYLE